MVVQEDILDLVSQRRDPLRGCGDHSRERDQPLLKGPCMAGHKVASRRQCSWNGMGGRMRAGGLESHQGICT